MNHPEIRQTEINGSRFDIGKFLGICVNCGEPLWSGFEYWEDNENIYCCRECADKFHGLHCAN